MVRFLITRLAAALPVLLVVVAVAFAMSRLAPGDAAQVIAGEHADMEQVARIRAEYHLNDPSIVQFGSWLSHVARGDLGKSLVSGDSIATTIRQRAPITVVLGSLGMLIAVCLGVPMGLLAARRRGSWIDRSVMVFAVLGFAVPSFLLAYCLIFVFSRNLGWLPSGGYTPISDGVRLYARSLVLPAAALGLAVSALIARITRAAVLDTMRQDFMRTARAKGLTGRTIVLRHLAPNAAIPVLTVIGTSTAYLLSGTVVIETVFSVPGMGRLLVDAAVNRDYAVLQAGILFSGVTFVLINLCVDTLYVLIDPRLRK